jgi:hypothetical protein
MHYTALLISDSHLLTLGLRLDLALLRLRRLMGSGMFN